MRNEEASLVALLESVREQTFPPDEIILVDGGSTDGTLALARRLADEDARIHVIEAGEATPGRGRNVGIAAAAHELVALTDAGITLDTTWLERLARVIEDDPAVEVVYGNFEPVADTLFVRCAALAYGAHKQARPGGHMRGPSTASMMLRREVWRKLSGFPDLRASEDLIFMKKIERGAFRVGWAPGATVWWQMQPDLIRTFRKFVLYSKYNVWAGRQADWHYSAALKYAVALLFIVLAIFHSPWWLLAVAAGFAARIGRSIWRRREGRGVLWALNPVQFACVGVILLTIDMATFVGWAQALWKRSENRASAQATIR
jgi:glycosyltransferase involved in cell wall biosynthesis